MTTELYANISGLTQQLQIELHDYDAAGHAVWLVSIGDEIRYIEGDIADDIWVIIEKAIRAYDD